jgi:hypothetical protein
LIPRGKIDESCRDLAVEIANETSISVPPHLIKLLSQDVADYVVDRSDRFFSYIPLPRKHGGQLVFTTEKPAC